MAVDFFQQVGSGYRLRFQVAGAILCTVLPYFARHWLPFGDQSLKIMLVSTIGSMVASLLGLFFIRNVNAYPGVEGSAYIVPSFCVAFGAILSVFFFSRLEYSRSLFLATFLLNILFFYAVYFQKQRRSRITVAMVPGGDVAALSDIPHIQWVPLASPDADLGPASAVVADLRADLSDEWDRRLADFALSGVPVYHSKHLNESLTGRVELEHLSENSFGTLSPISAYMTAKHMIDWIVALMVAIVLMPAFLILSVAIMLDSRGSPIFRQRRIGYCGRSFVMWKFRTMTTASAGSSDFRAAAMTAANDQRVTRIGRFLRQSRIDELPQIVNVLKREMSWIGPRPEAEVLSHWYEAEIPFYRYRHIVRPGITGWAQVNQGHVAEVDEVRAKLYYDFYYIKNFSPWIDFLICARTVRTMLTGFGAR
jgi:lipopolysaccharide/colanic/teichoic acid biosynthesis glycosyltransferase